MARPCHCRRISEVPDTEKFSPENSKNTEEVLLPLDCLEAMRLADCEGLAMEEGARQMGISRHTFGRILRKGRRVVAMALWNGKTIRIDDGACVLKPKPTDQGDRKMSEEILVAVPSEEPGGLDARPSAHFGHCAAYTVAKISDGKITDTRVVANKGHEHGGCVQPVRELAQEGVRALLAGGMGMKPLAAMTEAGIHVYFTAGQPTVKDALEAFAAGKLEEFGTERLCKGHCGHHHEG